MLIYYSLIATILILGMLFNKKYKNSYVIIICILLSLVAGLRHYTIGNDTINYLIGFNNIANQGENAIINSRFEIGYSLFCLLFTKFNFNFNLYLFVVSLIINLAFGSIIIKYSKNPMYSLFLFILCRFYFSEMNILRQMLATAIILYSLKYIEQKSFLKFLICVIIATLFHKSSFIVIIMYFLYNLNLHKKHEKTIIISSLIIFVFLGPLLLRITSFLGSYSQYIKKFMNSNELANIISTAIYLLECLFAKYVIKNSEESMTPIDNFSYNMVFTTMIINFLAIKISILDRCSIYFEIFSLLLIPNYIAKIKKGKNRMLWYVLFFVFFLAYFLLITYLRPNWNHINPYRFFWE